MSASNPVIQVNGLAKNYKKTQAVRNLTLDIQAGELFGLVGPDGAGKTTTLRLLAGLLNLDGGSATILDIDLATQAEQIKPRVGYMAQQFSLYADLSVMENLIFFAELFDVPKQAIQERSQNLLAFAGLSEFTRRKAAHLSGGMQKKLALVCTLIHEPAILLLDEPTTGVDPVSRREFWNILTDLHMRGTTIVVSTPYMDEADRCSQVGLMYSGSLVMCASPADIRASLSRDVIEVQTPDWRQIIASGVSIPGVDEIQSYGESIHFLVEPGSNTLAHIKQYMKENGLEYSRIRVTQPRMEEAFISLIKRQEA